MKFKNENKTDVAFVILIMAITSVLSIFIACATVASREYEKSHDEIKESKTEFMFERIGFGTRASEEIVYDKKTKVMYINDSSGRYSVIVNPDGTPRLYEKE